jgi:RimJ/RimL family protein N-acetyltransferase
MFILKFIPFIFDLYNLHKISLEVLSTNTRAISLYENLGFIKDGVKREEVYKNGKWIDSIIMSILKSEYEFSN